MKALVLNAPGSPDTLRITEHPKPSPGPHEVRVEVMISLEAVPQATLPPARQWKNRGATGPLKLPPQACPAATAGGYGRFRCAYAHQPQVDDPLESC